MKKNKNFWESLKHAIDGLVCLFQEEKNMWIHTLVAIFVVAFGFVVQLNHIEWLLVVLCIVAVIASEIMNTLIERMMNRISTEYDEQIKKIKDISAGFVLLVSIGSVIVGLLIFVPKLISFFG